MGDMLPTGTPSHIPREIDPQPHRAQSRPARRAIPPCCATTPGERHVAEWGLLASAGPQTHVTRAQAGESHHLSHCQRGLRSLDRALNASKLRTRTDWPWQPSPGFQGAESMAAYRWREAQPRNPLTCHDEQPADSSTHRHADQWLMQSGSSGGQKQPHESCMCGNGCWQPVGTPQLPCKG